MFIFFLLSFILSLNTHSEEECSIRLKNMPVQYSFLEQAQMDSKEKISTVDTMCNELDPVGLNKGIYEKPHVTIRIESAIDQAVTYPMTQGLWWGAFTKLQATERQRAFTAELEKIKLNPNRYERIRDTYNLVTRFQGNYDYKTLGSRADWNGWRVFRLTPGNVIDAGDEKGPGGVCRHFAALLYYALNQVARPKDSSGVALGEDSFSVDFMGGYIPVDGISIGHAWVRVNLPFGEGDKKIFKKFDLDTTFNPKEFTPLEPRLTGLRAEEIKKKFDDCEALHRCLMKSYLSDPNPPSRHRLRPSPRHVPSIGPEAGSSGFRDRAIQAGE